MSLDPKKVLLAYSNYVADADIERRRMREALAMFIAGAISLRSAGVDPKDVLDRQSADMQRGIGRKFGEILSNIASKEEAAYLGLKGEVKQEARVAAATAAPSEGFAVEAPKSGSDIPPPPVVAGSYRASDSEPVAFDLVEATFE